MKLFIKIVVLSFVSLVFFTGVSDAAQEYKKNPGLKNLQNVLKWAYIKNPTILAAREELQAQAEAIPQALAGWRPTIQGSASHTYGNLSVTPGPARTEDTQDVALSFSQPLYRGGRTTAEVEAAENLVNTAEALMHATEHNVLLSVVTAYMDVLRDEALLKLSENNKRVIVRQLEATKDRFRVGELTRTDVSQAEARFADARADVTNVRGNLRTSRAVYSRITGLEALGLRKPKIVIELPGTIDEAIAAAEKNNPNFVAAKYALAASRLDIDGAFGALLPEINLEGSVSRTYDNLSPFGGFEQLNSASIGVTASLSLYEGGGLRSRVREAKSIARQREIQILETQRQVRQDVVSAWEALETARAEIKSRREQVKASSIAREGVHQENLVGSRTVLDVLDADQELLDANVALEVAKRNEVVARFGLVAAIGALTPQSLGFPEVSYGFEAYKADISSPFKGTSVKDITVVEE